MYQSVATKLFGHNSHRTSIFNLRTGASNSASAIARGHKIKSKDLPDLGAPRDIRTAKAAFNLKPQITIYACCPACSFCHPPEYHPGSPIASYPTRCRREQWGTTCGARLVKHRVENKLSVKKPIRPFGYHHLNDHVAAMLSQPGVESAVEDSWKFRKLTKETRDIVDTERLRNFPWSKESCPGDADSSHGPELRLVWALSVDWFNPFHNKIAGKSASVGHISFTCLNLPGHLRNEDDNIFLVGIIPGPREPKGADINELIKPVVEDLQRSFNAGAFISQTYKYPGGRCVRSGLHFLASDLLASRKVAGCSSHSSNCFCSLCQLKRHDINNIDPKTWPPPIDRKTYLAMADAWRYAQNRTAQKKLWKQNGIRWSPLLELSYWDPTRCVALDAMHNLFLGLMQHHSRVILGLRISSMEKDEKSVCDKQLQKANDLLSCTPTAKSLKRFTMPVLGELCRRRNLTLSPPESGHRKKKDFIAALLTVCYPSKMAPSPKN